MKKIYLLIIILLLTSCSAYKEEKEDYNYLEDNTIRFIKTEDSVSFLINKDNKYYLLLLGNDNVDIEVDYLIKINNIKSKINSKKEYYLDNNLVLDNISFNKNDKIEIRLNNKLFCIYIKDLDKNNYNSCDYLYLYKIDKDFYISLTSNLLVLFYDSYTKFNYKFLYELASVWIDSYTIDNSSYTDLTILDNDFIVTSSKIRGKTIHKKKNS